MKTFGAMVLLILAICPYRAIAQVLDQDPDEKRCQELQRQTEVVEPTVVEPRDETREESSPATIHQEVEVNIKVPSSGIDVQNEPVWETRDGIEKAAKAYYHANRQYIIYRDRGDSEGMKKAQSQIDSLGKTLNQLRESQAKTDAGQNSRLDGQGKYLRNLHDQVNGKGGVIEQLGELTADRDAQKKLNIPSRLSSLDDKVSHLILAVYILGIAVVFVIVLAAAHNVRH